MTDRDAWDELFEGDAFVPRAGEQPKPLEPDEAEPATEPQPEPEGELERGEVDVVEPEAAEPIPAEPEAVTATEPEAPAPSEPAPAPAPAPAALLVIPPRRGFHLTPRRAFTLLAIALAVVLIGLLVYLLYFLGRPGGLAGEPSRAGLQAIWTVSGPGAGDKPLFSRPMGIALGSRGRIYVTDSGNNRVCVFDSSGRFLFEFGSFGIAKPFPGGEMTYVPGSLNFPVGIDTDSAGRVYVASLRNDSIEVFDAEGRPVLQIPDPDAVVGAGSSGQGGRGIAVTDVAVHDDRVYATDQYQIVVFNREGELVDQWGRPGSAPDELDHPNGLAVSEDGMAVYVADTNNNRVSAFTPSGELLWQVGVLEDRRERDIELPRGLCVLDDGSILAVDAFGFRLTRISPDGEIIGRYGQRGVMPAELNFPNDAESWRGFVILADKENGRIQMVRLAD